jgi:hypothetical protein
MKQILLSIGFLIKRTGAYIWKCSPAWVLFLVLIILNCNCSNKKQDNKNYSQNSSINIINNKKIDILDTNQIIQNLKKQVIQYYDDLNKCNTKGILLFLPEKYTIKKVWLYDSVSKLIILSKYGNSNKSSLYCGDHRHFIKVYEPTKLIVIKDTIQTTLVTSYVTSDFVIKIILVCISNNKGQNWKFMEIELETNLKDLKIKFPELYISNKLQIPKLKQTIHVQHTEQKSIE